MKVAIQGGKASFHHIAANKFFKKDVEILESSTFRGACEMVQNHECDFGLLAIENSIAASILLNYDLIRNHNLKIVGEQKISIHQHLMALPGQKIEDIDKVISHYMALNQCHEFLNEYPHIHQEQFHDTADAAKEVRTKNLTGVAAIAGELAAETYGLEILAREIETMKLNYTRFYVVAREHDALPFNQESDKATICFTLPNEIGSLAKALQVVVNNHINLTKIQSVPLVNEPDKYRFYIDCMWDEYTHIKQCLVQLKQVILNLEVLGEYKNCPLPFANYS